MMKIFVVFCLQSIFSNGVGVLADEIKCNLPLVGIITDTNFPQPYFGVRCQNQSSKATLVQLKVKINKTVYCTEKDSCSCDDTSSFTDSFIKASSKRLTSQSLICPLIITVLQPYQCICCIGYHEDSRHTCVQDISPLLDPITTSGFSDSSQKSIVNLLKVQNDYSFPWIILLAILLALLLLLCCCIFVIVFFYLKRKKNQDESGTATGKLEIIGNGLSKPKRSSNVYVDTNFKVVQSSTDTTTSPAEEDKIGFKTTSSMENDYEKIVEYAKLSDQSSFKVALTPPSYYACILAENEKNEKIDFCRRNDLSEQDDYSYLNTNFVEEDVYAVIDEKVKDNRCDRDIGIKLRLSDSDEENNSKNENIKVANGNGKENVYSRNL